MNQAELFLLHPKRRHQKPPPAKLRLTQWEPSENEVLPSLLKALPFFKRVAWFERMNSGAYVVGEGKARRYIKYGFKGCSDIIGQMVDGRFLSIEAKRPSGTSSDAQAAFLALVNANGGIGFVAKSIDDLREHLG